MIKRKRKGITLVETLVAAILMSILSSSIIVITNLVMSTYSNTSNNLSMYTSKSIFIDQLNTQIKRSSTGFTIPESSFVVEKLDNGWNYIGMMENVRIPKSVSHNKKEIESTKAIVYLEYVGETKPSIIPSDVNLVQNNKGGYFFQHILDHEYYNQVNNNYVSFDFKFVRTSDEEVATTSAAYEFTSIIKDSDGHIISSKNDDTIFNQLTVLNAIQVVYKGSESNPARAIAFSVQEIQSFSSVDELKKTQQPATVVFVLDFSGSMRSRLPTGETRLQALKDSVIKTIEQLSENDMVNVVLIPFATFAGATYFGKTNNPQWFYSLENPSAVSKLKDDINALQIPNYERTNVGDGFRQSTIQTRNLVKSLKEKGKSAGKVFLITVTDGAMNDYSTNHSSNYPYSNNYNPYNGNEWLYYYRKSNGWWSYTYYYNFKFDAVASFARQYAKDWGTIFKNEFNPKSFLVSIDKGMSQEDRDLLENLLGTQTVDVTSIVDFEDVFSEISVDINKYLWAFDGPSM